MGQWGGPAKYIQGQDILGTGSRTESSRTQQRGSQPGELNGVYPKGSQMGFIDVGHHLAAVVM